MENTSQLSKNIIIRSVQVLIAKLTQNPGSYPIRYYKKGRRSKNQVELFF